MKKLTKGALTMVLVGSVTFSAANVLLGTHSFKLPKSGQQKTMAGTNQREQTEKNPILKTADKINKSEKTVKDPTPTNAVKNVQSTIPHNIVTFNVVIKTESKSGKVVAIVKKDTTSTVTTSATPNTTQSAGNKTTDLKATASGTTSTNSTASITSSAPTTTITANHGKQVSQNAKDTAASRKDMKDNNGKKKGTL